MDTVVTNDSNRSAKASQMTHKRLGSNLKRLYADIVTEPVPDKILQLIQELEGDGERVQPTEQLKKRQE